MFTYFSLCTSFANGMCNASRDLIQLAQGSDKRVTRLTACTINGHRFHTKDRETRKKSQNSGVVVQADHEGKMIDFYGVLDDIIELSYIGSNKVLIFKCEWWDVGNKKRINVDEFDFVSVNITKTCSQHKYNKYFMLMILT